MECITAIPAKLFRQAWTQSRAKHGGVSVRGDGKKTDMKKCLQTCIDKCTVDTVTSLILKVDRKTHTENWRHRVCFLREGLHTYKVFLRTCLFTQHKPAVLKMLSSPCLSLTLTHLSCLSVRQTLTLSSIPAQSVCTLPSAFKPHIVWHSNL